MIDLFEFREETRREKLEEKGKFADSLEDKWKIEQRRRNGDERTFECFFLSARWPTKISL